MTTNARLAEIARLAGDTARIAMLQALMDGRALTAAELAQAAGITPQTASGHLARLVTADLLAVREHGRRRYHRLASPAVAQMLEQMMRVAALAAPSGAAPRVGPRDAALRRARTCYDHLAGQLGVAIADAMVAAGHAELSLDAGIVTEGGVRFLEELGIELEATPRRSRRVLCRPCLDWSERRPHLAGAVGAALCTRCLEEGWVRRREGTRAVEVTPAGYRVFKERFGVVLG